MCGIYVCVFGVWPNLICLIESATGLDEKGMLGNSLHDRDLNDLILNRNPPCTMNGRYFKHFINS